eukprot:556665-Prorocentrum_lima.AAC.1
MAFPKLGDEVLLAKAGNVQEWVSHPEANRFEQQRRESKPRYDFFPFLGRGGKRKEDISDRG